MAHATFGSDEPSHARWSRNAIWDRMNRPIRGGRMLKSLGLRAVDIERFDCALTTILSPLAHERCDDWRSRVESSVAAALSAAIRQPA